MWSKWITFFFCLYCEKKNRPFSLDQCFQTKKKKKKQSKSETRNQVPFIFRFQSNIRIPPHLLPHSWFHSASSYSRKNGNLENTFPPKTATTLHTNFTVPAKIDARVHSPAPASLLPPPATTATSQPDFAQTLLPAPRSLPSPAPNRPQPAREFSSRVRSGFFRGWAGRGAGAAVGAAAGGDAAARERPPRAAAADRGCHGFGTETSRKVSDRGFRDIGVSYHGSGYRARHCPGNWKDNLQISSLKFILSLKIVPKVFFSYLKC